MCTAWCAGPGRADTRTVSTLPAPVCSMWAYPPLRLLHRYSLGIASKLNARFNTTWGASMGKSADVAGVSRAVVPIMAKAGLKALHIGFNSASQAQRGAAQHSVV